jgi:exonuclease III
MQGDINISHRRIDHCDPGSMGDIAFEDQPHRQWMNSFVCTLEEGKANTVGAEGESSPTPPRSGNAQLVDVFRHFYPTQTKAYTVRCCSSPLKLWQRC